MGPELGRDLFCFLLGLVKIARASACFHTGPLAQDCRGSEQILFPLSGSLLSLLPQNTTTEIIHFLPPFLGAVHVPFPSAVGGVASILTHRSGR